MRILHSSDWHLGASLYGFSRYNEQKSFLQWLLKTIEEYTVDTLLISGDIFDSASPSNAAKALYSNFLAASSDGCCSNVIITGGNHDSPSWLDADAKVFHKLGCYVLGQATGDLDDEIIVLRDKNGKPSAVICAVPYLRERDLNSFTFGQSIDEHDRLIAAGIKKHYKDIEGKAKEIVQSFSPRLPIIAMGHLFVRGVSREDGENKITVGTLGEIDSSIFSDAFDYVALGHIHTPQKIGNNEYIRYCGSPLKMNFSEKTSVKQVILLDIDNESGTIQKSLKNIDVPQSCELLSIRGPEDKLKEEIIKVAFEHKGAYLEAVYVGTQMRQDLREILIDTLKEKFGDDIPINLVRIRHEALENKTHSYFSNASEIKELTPTEMFYRILDDNPELGSKDKDLLNTLYQQILNKIEFTEEKTDDHYKE